MNTDLFIQSFLSEYKNYKDYWNYEDGCVLIGSSQMYDATSDKLYLDFILKYLEPVIDEDGVINNYESDKHNIDSFNCGKILFWVYKKTKDEKFRKAIEFLINQLKKQPRIPEGNFWHKQIYGNQVWLDGLYMAQPFYMEYETIFNNKGNYNDILNQFRTVRLHMFDKDKGLYYHGYDDARIQPWADKIKGTSPNFWLRSEGWYLMALIDVIDVMSKEIYEQYREYCDMFKEALYGILKYQDKETKLFYQVIDKPDYVGNYTETSGSAMIAYVILKACRLGVINSEKYAYIGLEILDGIEKYKLIQHNGKSELSDICCVAGLGPGNLRNGSVEYYISEPKVSNDAKGVGPYIMAYAQRIMLKNNFGG